VGIQSDDTAIAGHEGDQCGDHRRVVAQQDADGGLLRQLGPIEGGRECGGVPSQLTPGVPMTTKLDGVRGGIQGQDAGEVVR
jgi:hypothetical protein